MAVNDFTFNQVATLLNSIQQQATGQTAITATNTYEFVTCAQTTLRTGYDPIINAINQVLSKTIFSVRPYSRKFKGLEVSEAQWGNHVRKLSIADKPIQDDDRYKYPVAYDANQTPPEGDGLSVDQYILNKPRVLQTNFYGQNVFQDSYTLFKDQIDNAFQGPEQLGSFVQMVVQNMSDKLENARENMARATVSNFIGGLIDENSSDRIIHLLTEYNTLTGQTLTAQDVYLPANFRPFMQWVFSRIAAVSAMMTERSQKFQTVINNLPIMRHTPYTDQKVYLYAPAQFQIETQVLANTFNASYLKLADNETVNFWQSIDTPDTINVMPSRVDSSGGVHVPGAAITQGDIFGIIFDREAMGYAVTQQWSNPSPFNARGGYTNIWIHETQRNWNDHSEKAVLLLLD